MGCFLYFVPDRSAGLSNKEISDIGLGYALDGTIHQQGLSGAGPGGLRGVLLACGCDPSMVRYADSEQQWYETPFGYWIGLWIKDRPNSAALARDSQLDGHYVVLADGDVWLAPMARKYLADGWYHVLPRTVKLGPERKWEKGDVVAKYKRLWDNGQAWWDARLAAVPVESQAGDDIRIDFDCAVTLAVESLSENYRIGQDEVSILGLFDSTSAKEILDALIDFPGLLALMEAEKKTE
jgi:hypothetical protein